MGRIANKKHFVTDAPDDKEAVAACGLAIHTYNWWSTNREATFLLQRPMKSS